MTFMKMAVIVSLFLSVSACATTYNPATEKSEFIFITTPMEVSIGKATASQVSRDFKISKDKQKNNRLKEIGERLAAVSDRKDLKYQFFVIEDESLNAFTTPGGYLYVNSGLMDKATDDELACVVGHEIGHVAARHVAKKLQTQIGYDILMNIAAQKSGVSELQKAASITYNLVMLGYSREDELLSDRLGVKYAYKAGYDPYAMVSFLKKLQAANEGDMGFIFLRSHPYTSQRIKMMEQQIPTIIERAGKQTAIDSVAQGQINTASLKEISDEKRPLKVMCPVCRRIYPGTTRYCPYDGTELK
ncbi:MAG: M48 family metallopeptidase [Candidatus Omnitrophota bacterium]